MLNLVKSEPVAFAALIQAVLNLALSFGLHLSPDQIGAINVLVAAIQALVIRQVVTPTSNVSTLPPPH